MYCMVTCLELTEVHCTSVSSRQVTELVTANESHCQQLMTCRL